MSPSDLLRFAAGALRGHGLRTALTLTGVAIGVAAVLILTGLGEGARRYVSSQFASIGSNLVMVVPGKNETTGFMPNVMGVPNDLTLADALALERGIPEVGRVAPFVMGSSMVRFRERSRDLVVIGATTEFEAVQHLEVAFGSFLPTTSDLERGASVAVLGSEAASELFQDRSAVGERIRIGDARFTVVGVLASRGPNLGIDLNEAVFIPVATGMRLFNRSSLFRIALEARGTGSHTPEVLARIESRATAILKERHGGDEDVSFLTQDAVVSTLSSILRALTAALVAIATISLGVAGIGIMNVMLVSVSERTAEVGLLKALGVSRRKILSVFLAEAALLSGAGGAIGLALGLGSTRALRIWFPDFNATPPLVAILAAGLVALSCGLGFGVLPARRATKLDPIASLAQRS